MRRAMPRDTMNTNEAKLTVWRAQLSHARLGLSTAAGDTVLAGAWLAECRALEGKIAKLEAEMAGELASA